MAQAPHPVDTHVGKRLRLRRTLLGMSQERLAELLGLTFQQVQKYERGANRIGSSRLYEISSILDVPVSFFFDDMAARDVPGASPSGLAEDAAAFIHDNTAALVADEPGIDQRETLELVRAYHRIDDPALRRRVFDLIKALAHLDAPRDGGSA